MKINKVILGTVQFGLKYGINNLFERPDQQQVNKMLNLAFQEGIDCLDTAEAYGNAHSVIGKFHKSFPNVKFDVITKLPQETNLNVHVKVQQYLKDLNVSRLKGVFFHSFEGYLQNRKGIRDLISLKQDKIIEHIGVSVYTNQQALEVIKDGDIDIIQLPFNLFDNLIQRGDVISIAKRMGKQVHTRSAFLQGLFFSDVDDPRPVVRDLSSELKLLRELSKRFDVSLNAIALNYCLQQPDIDHVIIGVDNLSQLKENIVDIKKNILPSLIYEIDNIKIENSEFLNPSKWTV